MSLGDQECILSAATDITDRKEDEEKLRLLGQITEQVHDACMTTDLNYRISYVNRSFERLYGYSKEEILGRLPDMLNADTQPEEIQNDI